MKLFLAGRNFPAEISERKDPGVIFEGEVKDAQAFMLGKQLMVVPLKSGGGRRVKIIQGMALGKTIYKREFLGLLIGRLVMKSFFKNDKPMDKNVPAGPLSVKRPVNSNFDEDKKQWLHLIEEYGRLNDHEMMHPFFGRLTKEQVGQFAFKHSDHHLRQFNV